MGKRIKKLIRIGFDTLINKILLKLKTGLIIKLKLQYKNIWHVKFDRSD